MKCRLIVERDENVLYVHGQDAAGRVIAWNASLYREVVGGIFDTAIQKMQASDVMVVPPTKLRLVFRNAQEAEGARRSVSDLVTERLAAVK
jgi:hypothetical protein